MRKNPKTWFARWFWPTELTLRFSHCYAPHGTKLYSHTPALERPRRHKRGPRLRATKHLRLRRAFSEWCNPLPF